MKMIVCFLLCMIKMTPLKKASKTNCYVIQLSVKCIEKCFILMLNKWEELCSFICFDLRGGDNESY